MNFNLQSSNGGTRLLLVLLLALIAAQPAAAFIVSDNSFDPWLSTALGSRTGNGQPVTLTWSIIADGIATPDGENGPSIGGNLIGFLDTNFGGNHSGANPSDLTARPWFDLFQQSVDRWEELSGIDYVYHPTDDNRALGSGTGILDVRADVRIGGRALDGSGSTLAFNYLPNNGDMVIDTSESSYFGNASNNFVRLRNTIMHELGHGLGLEHVVSTTDALLLEPSINPSFDGPQLDEVRAAHYYYGDVHEKSNNGLGNGIAARATDLGAIALGSFVGVGADADVPDQRISATATDFVSISNLADDDYFSFDVSAPGALDVMLSPRGGQFTQGPQGGTPSLFNADARSNLRFDIFDTDGSTVLATVNDGGLGDTESLDNLFLDEAGEYFVRVRGGPQDTIQLYELELSFEPPISLAADFNQDDLVDNTDLRILQASYGLVPNGDANGDNLTAGTDFLIWQQLFNGTPSGFTASSLAVPEPASAMLLMLGTLALQGRRQRGISPVI